MNKHTIAQYNDDFTYFKADNVFTTLSIAAHYRYLLRLNSMKKHMFYAVTGPSLDYKISNIRNENLINASSNRLVTNGDIGGEFDNNGYYILFIHYKLVANLLKFSLPIYLNRFEIGKSIKSKYLF
jgi:hypothetical protein